MRQLRNRQKGTAELLGVLMAASLMLVLFAIAAPNLIQLQRTQNENAAAVQLSQLNSAETAAGQLWGGYFPPNNLAGSLASPISCSNPFLISGQQAQAPEGYTLQFTGSGGAGIACGAVNNFKAFTISLDPTNSLQAQRHFVLSSSDGLIHFNSTGPASIADTVMPVAAPSASTTSTIVIQGSGNGGTGTGTGGTGGGTASGLNGTYTLAATFSIANGGCSGAQSGTLTVESAVTNGNSNLTGSLCGGTCALLGTLVANGAANYILLNAGTGCPWGGSYFAQQTSGDLNISGNGNGFTWTVWAANPPD